MYALRHQSLRCAKRTKLNESLCCSRLPISRRRISGRPYGTSTTSVDDKQADTQSDFQRLHWLAWSRHTPRAGLGQDDTAQRLGPMIEPEMELPPGPKPTYEQMKEQVPQFKENARKAMKMMHSKDAGLTERLEQTEQQKSLPPTPNFYTGRSVYHDSLAALERSIQLSRQALTSRQLFPLPTFAREAIPPSSAMWKPREVLAEQLGCKLPSARYRRIIATLSSLHELERIAKTAGETDLYEGISRIVSQFEKTNKDLILASKRRRPVKFDKYGRSYTVGRRKTSSARVWMIVNHKAFKKPREANLPQLRSPLSTPELSQVAVNSHHVPENPLSENSLSEISPSDIASKSVPDTRDTTAPPKPTPEVFASSVLVNNRPLAEYFPLQVDREKVMRPLRLAGVIGAYNVFALARGGGTTGQSGAIMQAVAKGLAAHEPQLDALLRRAKLLRRDPRMVERKKTGLAKARKRYSWVKR